MSVLAFEGVSGAERFRHGGDFGGAMSKSDTEAHVIGTLVVFLVVAALCALSYLVGLCVRLGWDAGGM